MITVKEAMKRVVDEIPSCRSIDICRETLSSQKVGKGKAFTVEVWGWEFPDLITFSKFSEFHEMELHEAIDDYLDSDNLDWMDRKKIDENFTWTLESFSGWGEGFLLRVSLKEAKR